MKSEFLTRRCSSKNVTEHRPYPEFYDQSAINLVAKHWAAEIELFGYSFGDQGPARPGRT